MAGAVAALDGKDGGRDSSIARPRRTGTTLGRALDDTLCPFSVEESVNIGEQLSHYRIVGKLGEGGMGVVYRAEDLRLGRPVALKVLAPRLAGDAVARHRFEAEARAASALDHPNICSLYDVGETHDGRLFLALAFCEGETLRAALDRGPVEPPKAIEIALQIADGLAVAHAKGIVHRDVKPANVMVRPDGLVKILDFGVAKVERDAGVTGPTDSIGSPAYMAPEQIQNARIGPAVDVWALGVVLYEMIAGCRPFEGDGIHGILYGILNSSPRPLERLRPGVHPRIVRVISRALAKDPGARYASAGAFADDLRAIATEREEQTGVLRRGAALDADAVAGGDAVLRLEPVPRSGVVLRGFGGGAHHGAFRGGRPARAVAQLDEAGPRSRSAHDRRQAGRPDTPDRERAQGG